MNKDKNTIGKFLWTDLTVSNATELKEFYKEVIGWKEQAVEMKDGDETYHDYAMLADADTAVGGICNQRGANANIPPQWISYINVTNVEESLNKALQLGGKIIHESKKKDGSYNFVIIQDPVGAIFGIGQF